MYFEIVGEIRNVETFARGPGIRELPRLRNAMAAGAGASEKASPKCVSPMALSEKLNYIGMRHPVGKREFKMKRYWD